MKLKAFVLSLSLTMISGSALAQFFPARAFVTVLPGRVAAEVVNPHYEPIICNGQVFGQTAYGPLFSAFFAEQYMLPGQSRFAFVQANPFNPFVNGWANINCRFARWY